MATWQQIARADALRYGINPIVFLRQIMQESGGNPRARSSAGAEGIAQFMPGTAAGMHVNPWNVQSALAGAARMDAENLHRFGSYQKMLAAYNAGSGAVESGAWRNYPETTNYIRTILGSLKPQPYRGGGIPGLSNFAAGGGGGAAGAAGVRGAFIPAPIQVRPAAPQSTALDALQTFIAAHTPGQPDQAQPLPAPAPLSDTYSSQLDSIHSKLLKG